MTDVCKRFSFLEGGWQLNRHGILHKPSASLKFWSKSFHKSSWIFNIFCITNYAWLLKIQIVLTLLWKISQAAFHIVEIINVSSTKLSTLLIIWNIFATFLQLSQQIYGDFHKSFRNLPNFFREHGQGSRAIFHLLLNRLNQNTY